MFDRVLNTPLNVVYRKLSFWVSQKYFLYLLSQIVLSLISFISVTNHICYYNQQITHIAHQLHHLNIVTWTAVVEYTYFVGLVSKRLLWYEIFRMCQLDRQKATTTKRDVILSQDTSEKFFWKLWGRSGRCCEQNSWSCLQLLNCTFPIPLNKTCLKPAKRQLENMRRCLRIPLPYMVWTHTYTTCLLPIKSIYGYILTI